MGRRKKNPDENPQTQVKEVEVQTKEVKEKEFSVDDLYDEDGNIIIDDDLRDLYKEDRDGATILSIYRKVPEKAQQGMLAILREYSCKHYIEKINELIKPLSHKELEWLYEIIQNTLRIKNERQELKAVQLNEVIHNMLQIKNEQ